MWTGRQPVATLTEADDHDNGGRGQAVCTLDELTMSAHEPMNL